MRLYVLVYLVIVREDLDEFFPNFKGSISMFWNTNTVKIKDHKIKYKL